MNSGLPAAVSASARNVLTDYVDGCSTRWERFKPAFLKWWHGYIDEPAPHKAKRTQAAPVADEKAWTPERISVSQLVWGDGFTFPGGADYALQLAKTLCLAKDKSLLDLG